MRKFLVVIALAVVATVVGLAEESERTDATFHLMRVYGALGGAGGDADVQYVELRMAAAGQNLVSGHNICFFDSTGAPYARFTFPSNVTNSASGASILMGTAEFDTAWSAGSPDFTFSSANTVAIAGGADVDHPIISPAGKVSFGSDLATVPANMCAGSFGVLDSVAYGTGYSGTVDWGTKFNTDMPTAATDAVKLVGPLDFPGLGNDNSTDYALVDVNQASDFPRNNGNQTGAISVTPPLDSDGDTVPDASDNCPFWPNAGQALPPWNVPAGDEDCDGFTTTVESTVGTDTHDACGFTAGAPGTSDSWPPDLVETNTITISDVLALKPVFNSTVPPTSVRFDLVPSSSITISDVLAIKPVFNASCTP